MLLRRAQGNVSVDLSKLEHIGFQVDTLIVDVICGDQGSSIRGADVLPQLQNEIDRLGHALIGPRTGRKFASKTQYGAKMGVRWTFGVCGI